MKSRYVTVIYNHNGRGWQNGSPYAMKKFCTVPEAESWISNNPQFTPKTIVIYNTRYQDNFVYRRF